MLSQVSHQVGIDSRADQRCHAKNQLSKSGVESEVFFDAQDSQEWIHRNLPSTSASRSFCEQCRHPRAHHKERAQGNRIRRKERKAERSDGACQKAVIITGFSEYFSSQKPAGIDTTP
jgi:hypothetical protein